MALEPRDEGALTVPIAGEATDTRPPPSTAFAQVSNTPEQHTRASVGSGPSSGSSSTKSASESDGANDNPDVNRAVIAVSVIMAIASLVVLIWYFRERRLERNNTRHRDDTERERQNRSNRSTSLRSVMPLQTSFHPSWKSSFGFTGASPDSPWSCTQSTITPLTRVAVTENLFSPMSQDGVIPSPRHIQSPGNSGTIPMPPVTANTSRTFRTSIRSIMVNRDSTTNGARSLADDFFPLSPDAKGRPRLTRLPSYHTDYHKSSPYIPIDQKRGFVPGPDTSTLDTSPSDYTSTIGLGHGVPRLPTTAKQLSEMTMSFPTSTLTFDIKSTRPSFIRPPKPPRGLPHIRTRSRESELEYLNAIGTGPGSNDTPSSTASLRAMVNTSEPASARPSRGNSFSEDLRGLLFLGSSVTVQDRPVKETGPAAPDLSPTRGWSRLPDIESETGRRLL